MGGVVSYDLKYDADFSKVYLRIEESASSWISLLEVARSSVSTFSFLVAENNFTTERKGSIVFVDKENGLSQSVTITQQGKISDNPLDYFDCAFNELLYVAKEKHDFPRLEESLISHHYDERTRVGRLTFDSNVYVIPSYTFGMYIEYVKLPECVVTIKTKAFNYCQHLKSLTIPDSVTSIEEDIIYASCSLEGIFGKYASDNNRCLIKDGVFIGFASGLGLKEYTIPDGVTRIGAGAFVGAGASLETLHLPSSVVEIGREAFFNNVSLSNITIPEGVVVIEQDAFCGCEKLPKITLPATLTSMGYRVFGHCPVLKTIYCKAKTPPVPIGSIESVWGWFYKTPNINRIHIPIGSKSLYWNADGWYDVRAKLDEYSF